MSSARLKMKRMPSTGAIALANDDLSVAEDFLSEAVHHSPVYFAEAEKNLARVRRERGEISSGGGLN